MLDTQHLLITALLPPAVKEFLAHKITSNVRELEGALTRIIAHATLVGREISLESTQELLQDLLRAQQIYEKLGLEVPETWDEFMARYREHFGVLALPA